MEIQIQTQCASCQHDQIVTVDIDPIQLAPDVRGGLQPISSVFIYKITSEMLKEFLVAKAKMYVPDVKMEVVPRYCEKKRRRDNEPHRSYASLRIAFSENVIAKNADAGWFGKIGQSGDNVRVIDTLFHGFIQRYGYKKKDLDQWLSYKNLEELEESFGMTEAYINSIRELAIPRLQKTQSDESWVFFAAAAESVIADMLTNPTTDKPAGRIQIQDVHPISNDVVEFIVYLYPADLDLKENPRVRRILTGEEKIKK